MAPLNDLRKAPRNGRFSYICPILKGFSKVPIVVHYGHIVPIFGCKSVAKRVFRGVLLQNRCKKVLQFNSAPEPVADMAWPVPHKKRWRNSVNTIFSFWVCPGPIGLAVLLSWNVYIITKKEGAGTPLKICHTTC